MSSISSPDYSQQTKAFPKGSTHPMETAIIYSSSLCPSLLHLLFLLPTGLLSNVYQDLSFVVTSSTRPPRSPNKNAGIIYHITVISLTALLREDLPSSRGGLTGNKPKYFKVTTHLLVHCLECKLGSLLSPLLQFTVVPGMQ